MSNPAQQTLTAISKTFFGGRNYNDKYYYDDLKETPKDGVAGSDFSVASPTPKGEITGHVYEIISRGKTKEIGEFRISPTGKIKNFPSLPQDFIEHINGPEEKAKEVKADPVIEAPKKRGPGRPPNKKEKVRP